MNCKNCGCALDADSDFCYACGTPVKASAQEPAYTLEDPARAPAAPEAQEAPAPGGSVSVDNAQKAGFFVRALSFLFALLGLIFYGVQRKNGEESRAVSVADAIVAGLCAKMGVLMLYLMITFITHR